MKKIYYSHGQILGNNIVFLNEVKRINKIYARALFRCHCGKEFESDISPIKSFNTKSCGCLNTSEIIAKRETKHKKKCVRWMVRKENLIPKLIMLSL